jgi:hypothetical protein
MNDLAAGLGVHDFAFQTGEWRVGHRKLRRRLVGDTQWAEFEGRCSAWEFMGGAANADDYAFDDPAGAYAGASLRRCDPANGKWSIWWWDSRTSDLGPPVIGRFSKGVGIFLGDDVFNARPIKVRYTWSKITPTSAEWEQAFSPDNGTSWETNWIMAFERIRHG